MQVAPRTSFVYRTDMTLAIPNRHHSSCGKPPVLDPSGYLAYFENQYGEQWMLSYNRDTDVGVVTGGDIGWTEVPISKAMMAPDLIMHDAEIHWLVSCWSAILGKPRAEVVKLYDRQISDRLKKLVENSN